MAKYIQNPKTAEEALDNVRYGVSAVSSWLTVKDYTCARIKASALKHTTEELLTILRSLEEASELENES